MRGKINALETLIGQSSRIVFFGGAGVSTESGLKDFRSGDGVFQALKRFGREPEVLLSYTYFLENPDVFYTYYRTMLIDPTAKPNAAHRALAALEAREKLAAIITQNIDGLHQMAGSRRVLELHGSLHRNYCMACKAQYPLSAVLEGEGAPRCACGGVIRPDIVFYGEYLDETVMQEAITQVRNADMLIVGGTSLTVYPAAGMLEYYRGDRLVLINKAQTPADARAALAIHAPIGEVLGAL